MHTKHKTWEGGKGEGGGREGCSMQPRCFGFNEIHRPTEGVWHSGPQEDMDFESV